MGVRSLDNRSRKPLLCLQALTFLFFTIGAPNVHAASHALTLFESPKYNRWFDHFAYVNPDAPKGGTVRLAHPATFDSLNPYILQGVAAPGISSYVYESLMTRSLDEPQSYYPLIATSVDYKRKEGVLTFTLNPKARWHDGTPITVEDVIFSHHILTTEGDPSFRLQYGAVEKVEKVSQRKVRFVFSDPENRDIPFLMASMPILPKHYFEKRDFAKATLSPPLGSGPYRIEKVEPGRSITFARVEDYWAAGLPSQVGQYNFDIIRYDIYRDATVAIEALKSGEFDLHEEYIARNWATAYNTPAFERGDMKKYTARHKIPRGMQAFIFNLRRDKFKDRRVREAIATTLDFEWMNRTIFFDAYERNTSFFQNTRFSATSLPDSREKKLLDPVKEHLPPEIYDHIYYPPVTDGSGNERKHLLKAQRLLKEAGWELNGEGWRESVETGEVLSIEFLSSQKTFERVVSPMIRNLNRLGIKAHYRLVDSAQYMKRLEHKDYDITSVWWNLGQIYPGNEQLSYWHSSQADVQGSMNMSGLKNPGIDAILETLVAAEDIRTLETAAHALDRSLLWMHVVIPHWSISHFRVVYWDKFGMPEVRPTYGLGFSTWWVKKDD